MKTRVLLITLILFTSACAPKSDLLAAQKQVADLASKVSALEGRAGELQSRLAALQAENTRLKARLDQKPAMPVSVSFRKALIGTGYVAVFSTTVKSAVTISATVQSAALGTQKRFELHLDPSSPRSLGHLEGAVLDIGDTITMENQNYSPSTVTVEAK